MTINKSDIYFYYTFLSLKQIPMYYTKYTN